MPRSWDRDTFLAGRLASGIYSATLQTSFGFPFNGDATVIVLRPTAGYFQTAFIFYNDSNDANTTQVWANHWRSTGWSNWREL